MGEVRKWGEKRIQRKRYFSAEFQLESPRIFFQFRLRESLETPRYVVVKKDSQALSCLRVGETVAMTFHFEDNDIPAERREVLISSIEDAACLGLADHVMVALSL